MSTIFKKEPKIMNNDFNNLAENGQSAQNNLQDSNIGHERTQYIYGGYQGYTPPQRPKRKNALSVLLL